MCSTARCPHCAKTTWRGCGRHIDTVMAGVAAKDRCNCDKPEPTSLFRRIFR